jgi:predicted MFS family arabinose efflux permease
VVLSVVLTIIMGVISNPWIAAVVLGFYGVQLTLWNVVAISLRQTLTPDALRGRVAGVSRLLTWGTQPLGAALGGVAASLFGLRAPFFFAAAGMAALFLATVAIVNNRTIAAATEAATAERSDG